MRFSDSVRVERVSGSATIDVAHPLLATIETCSDEFALLALTLLALGAVLLLFARESRQHESRFAALFRVAARVAIGLSLAAGTVAAIDGVSWSQWEARAASRARATER